MKKLLTTLGLALLCCTAAAPSVSLADVPKAGDVVAQYGSVLCDKREQIVAIVKAGAKEFGPAGALAMKLAQTPNDLGQSTCVYATFANLHIKAIEALPDILVYPTGPVHTWVVEVASSAQHPAPTHLTYFVLWTQKVDADVKPSSLPPKGIGENGNVYIVLPHRFSILEEFFL